MAASPSARHRPVHRAVQWTLEVVTRGQHRQACCEEHPLEKADGRQSRRNGKHRVQAHDQTQRRAREAEDERAPDAPQRDQNESKHRFGRVSVQPEDEEGGPRNRGDHGEHNEYGADHLRTSSASGSPCCAK